MKKIIVNNRFFLYFRKMKSNNLYFPLFALLGLISLFSCQKEVKPVDPDAFAIYTEKAQGFLNQIQFDSAYYYYTKAKTSLSQLTNEQETFLLLQMATLQQYQGDFFGCEETITEALNQYKGTKYLPYLHNILATSYYKQLDYEHALLYFQKASEISTDSTTKAIFQNNIGLIYLENKEYKKAQATLEPLLLSKNIRANAYELARVQDNLGYTYFQLHHQDAFSYLTKAWMLRDSLQDNIGLIASNMHLSEYHLHSQPEKAKNHAHMALAASVKAESPDDQLEALKWLSEVGSLAESKQAYSHYIKLNDSLTKARNQAKNKFSKIKYDFKKSNQDALKYKNQNLILLVIIVFILLVGILFYFLYQSIIKRKLQRSAYHTETRISKRIHDELANDVFNVMTYTQTKDLQNSSNKEALLDALETIYERTRDISKENNTIRTDEHFEADLLQMITNFSSPQLTILIKNKKDILWSKLLPEKKIALFRVVQEMLINTKKHSEASIVVIDFQNQVRTIHLSYSDNGLGSDFKTKLKNGLQNAENRILAIKGTLTFDSQLNKGFRATLIIPK